MARMTSSQNRKAWWSIAECIVWICTRDHDRVAVMGNMNAEEAIRHAMLRYARGQKLTRGRPSAGSDAAARGGAISRAKARSGCVAGDARKHGSLTAAEPTVGGPQEGGPGGSSDTSIETGAWHDAGSVHLGDLIMMTSDQALGDLFEKAKSGHPKMQGRKVGTSDYGQIQPFELTELRLRIVPGYAQTPVGLWMPDRNAMIWTSLQCARADVMTAWPAPRTRTVTVFAAILRHLEEVMPPEAPLTKADARKRCLVDVPNAYPEAFERAWRQLETSRKRGHGKHGPRVHRKTGNVGKRPRTS